MIEGDPTLRDLAHSELESLRAQKEEILIKKELKFWVKGFKADLNKY